MAVTSDSRAERFKQGKELRRKTPREAHADLKGSMARNAVAILAESDPERVPELVPERYKRMMLNPFAFLRGAAAVMATDLAGQPMVGLPVQAGGDSHLMNFGAFVTPEDNILFDVNDFDETLPGVDFTVDLKRLAASVVVAALAAGANKKQSRAVAAATVKAYRLHMRSWPGCRRWKSGTAASISSRRSSGSVMPTCRRKLAGVIAKARGEGLSKDDNFPHLASGNDPRIVDKPPTIFHLDPKADARHRLAVERVFATYRKGLNPYLLRLLDRFTLKDFAFKAVGVGSVGTFCCVALVHDRRQRTAVPADQAGDAFGAGTPRRQARLQGKPGTPRRGRPTDDAGRERYLPRPHARRNLRSPVLRPDPEKPPAGRDERNQRERNRCRITPNYVAGRWRARMPAPASRRRSRATWARARRSMTRLHPLRMAYADQTNTDYAALVKAKGATKPATKANGRTAKAA